MHKTNTYLLRITVFFAVVCFTGSVNAFNKNDDVSKKQEHAISATTVSEKTKNAWMLPAFNLTGLDGKKHRLKEWQGKVILLNFWASWCAPCQYEIRDLTRYQRKLAEKGFQIVSLGFDEEQKLRNVHRSLEINYPVLIMEPSNPDTDSIMTQWGNHQNMVPYNVVIDRSGQIRYIHRGQLDAESFQEYVVPLL